MARAYKCDRCGTYYDNPADTQPSGFTWVLGRGLGNGIDLCADCCDELSEWIEGERETLTEQPVEAPQSGSVEEVEEVGEVVTSRADKPSLDVEEIVRERLSGKKPKEIAREYGVKPNTISNYISNFKSDYAERYEELKETFGVEGNP